MIIKQANTQLNCFVMQIRNSKNGQVNTCIWNGMLPTKILMENLVAANRDFYFYLKLFKMNLLINWKLQFFSISFMIASGVSTCNMVVTIFEQKMLMKRSNINCQDRKRSHYLPKNNPNLFDDKSFWYTNSNKCEDVLGCRINNIAICAFPRSVKSHSDLDPISVTQNSKFTRINLY